MDFEEFQQRTEEKIEFYWAEMNKEAATKDTIKGDRGRLQSLKTKL